MILYFRDQDIRADALAEGIDIGRQEGIDIGRQEGIFAMIEDALEDGLSNDHILKKLQKRFSLSLEQAQEAMARYLEKHPGNSHA